MMFLDCPAYLDQDGAARCGLPAEVSYRFTMRSTDGAVESAMIRCPVGHYFSGAIESLTWHGKDEHGPGSAAVASRTGRNAETACVTPAATSYPRASRDAPRAGDRCPRRTHEGKDQG